MIITQNKKEASNKLPFFISYFISDPSLFNNINLIFKKYNPNIVCFRDKETLNIEPLAKDFIKTARKSNINLVLINTHIDLAIRYKYDGVHLTSKQFNSIKKSKENKLFVIISCHTEYEVQLAKKLGADAITYSPIFYKKNKGKPKGIEDLKNIIEKYQDDSFSIIALGGIVDDTFVKQIESTKAKGFASIGYFNSI
ncbi:MAG: thiamine phosphate synthase [Epsilonproteobacteria bacterium]|nr:MAG: thiamine phosphate synthase [Campylobacterota bacterium]